MKVNFPQLLLLMGVVLCTVIYWPGLHGGYLFDDYPNIVDNTSLHVEDNNMAEWMNAALSSPASVFKRPLSMLSFTINYWASGLDPFWMKLTNLLLHLLNGILIFSVLSLLFANWRQSQPHEPITFNAPVFAVLASVLWLVAPINLSGVLYVVQRMEIIAQTFLLLGLHCYLLGRQKQIQGRNRQGYLLIIAGIGGGTSLGLAAKETAILLPVYVLAIEFCILKFADKSGHMNKQLAALLAGIVVVPGFVGLAWLLPGIVSGISFSGRDFTVYERLLTEARVVLQYLYWVLLPTPDNLSFYHDDIQLSGGWFEPPSTFFSTLGLAGLAGSGILTLKHLPLFSFGVFLFFISHSLTATILPLEIVFEHRNYFASLGAIISILAIFSHFLKNASQAFILSMACLYLLYLSSVTFLRSMEWAHPINFAYSEASRHPDSPRAQYELGRALVIASGYDPQSPLFTQAKQAFATGMRLPRASILPELALITLDARTGVTTRSELWTSIHEKLDKRPPREEEIAAVRSFMSCQIRSHCSRWPRETVRIVLIVLSHKQSPYLLSDYANYAAYILNDMPLARRVAQEAIELSGNDAEVYRAMSPIIDWNLQQGR